MSHTRTYQVQVLDTGAVSSPIQIGNEPNCLGWDLAISVILGPGMVLGTSVLCRDDWQGGGPGVTVGPFGTQVGGKIHVPFPALQIQAQDFVAANVGNASTIRIVARPVMANGRSQASSIVESAFTQPVAAGAIGVFNLPPMALDYKCTTSQAGPMRVSLLDAAGAELSFWEIANPSDTPFDSGGQNWRETGPPGSQVSIANGGAVNALLTVWLRYDFRRSR